MPTKLLPFQPIFRPIFTRVFISQSYKPPILKRSLLITPSLSQNLRPISTNNYSTYSESQRMGKGSRSGREMRAGASKSLVDDEAELSDWVSGLNSNTMKKTRVYSDSENDERVEKRRRDNDNDSAFSNRRGGRGAGSFADRRGGGRGGGRDGGRESYSGSFADRRGGGRGGERGGGRDSFSDRRGGSESYSSSFGDRRGGGRGGGRDSFSDRHGGSESYSGSFGDRRGGGRGGGRDSFSGSERGGSDSYSGRMSNERGGRGGRGRGNFSSGTGRGGGRLSSEFGRGGQFGDRRESFDDRGSEVRNRNGRGGGRGGDMDGRGITRGGKMMGRTSVAVSNDEDSEDENDDSEDEDEQEGKGYVGFKELIDSDEEDSDEEDDSEEEVEDEEEEEGNGGLFVKENVVSKLEQSSAGQNDSYLSESRFDQCSISALSLKGVKDAGYERMTMVQEATLPVILKGKDVMAKAKTGTGKTVAFLLPSIEHIVKSPPSARDDKRPPILVLVICPTRELASQAAAEATKLLKYHSSLGVQVVIGGTRLALEQKRMQANPCQILVATPGRLRDHVENTAGFATRLMGVKVLVLDEADHLLDMGFRKDIERIVAAVPKQRQTLLFSATIPPEVRQMSHIALKRDHEFINTVEEGSEDTHAQVRQTHLVAPLDKHFPLLYTMLKDHIADDVNYKILVFCTTAMVTRLVASLLGELKLNVREIHSRKPQSYRTRISDEFRKSKGLILVTSDVSARGVDYPDVTLVIQIGVPSDKQQYIHRLGRTGRKGKEGQGILMLAPWEEFFLSTIKDLPITKAPELSVDPDTRKKVERALSNVEMKNKEAAYQAWLGYYNSNKSIGRDKIRLVELANEFSRSMCLDNPPAIPKLVLGKMGLKNVPGLRSR